MGKFSWITKDGEQIRNQYHQGQKVWMVFKSDDGSNVVVREDEYEGYGEFGGIDYYVALFLMNKDKLINKIDWIESEWRDVGIYMNYTEIPMASPIEYPQLFTHEPSLAEIYAIDWFTPCPHDPNQGWVVEDDDWWDEDED